MTKPKPRPITKHELMVRDVRHWLTLRAFAASMDLRSGLLPSGVVASIAACVAENRVDEWVETWRGTATFARLQGEIASLEARHGRRMREIADAALAPAATREAA